MFIIIILLILVSIYIGLFIFQSILTKRVHLNIYFGIPGSGKTTVAAWIAKKAAKNKKQVYSNVPIKGTIRIDPQIDIGVYDISNGILLVDEAGLEYNNRDFKSFSKNSLYFYKMHRHYGMEVNIFSQGYDDMDKKLRTLAYNLYIVKQSLIPFFITLKKVKKYTGINKTTEDIQDCYKYEFFLFDRRIYAPALWKSFNTYENIPLPKKEFERW